MASWIKFDIDNKIVKYYDTGHSHGGLNPHMHVIDLSKLTVGDMSRWHEIRSAADYRELNDHEIAQLNKWASY